MKNQSTLIIIIQNQLVAKIQFALAAQYGLPETSSKVQWDLAKIIQKKGLIWREHAESIINHMKEEAAYYEFEKRHCYVDWNEQEVLDVVENEIKIHAEEFAEQIRK